MTTAATEKNTDVLVERRGPLQLITLNRPKALNALTLGMFGLIDRAITEAESDPSVRAIVLQGAGDRGYCAGGDVKLVVNPPVEIGPNYARQFFEAEYGLDERIYSLKKPFAGLAHGISMGGGLGLIMGARKRVFTEDAVLAMPEITIGLFPDVGASYFLPRLPRKIGLFLGLTGARLRAREAAAIGWIDAVIPSSARADWLDRVAGGASFDDATQALALPPLPAEENPIERTRTQIEAALSRDLPHFVAAMKAILADASAEPWLKTCAQTFLSGSPTSAQLTWEAFHRGAQLSLSECFRMELRMALEACRGTEFREGVRALLVDKDGRPRWQLGSW